jgi:hypothetical protein
VSPVSSTDDCTFVLATTPLSGQPRCASLYPLIPWLRSSPIEE